MSIEMQILQKALSSKHSSQYTNLKKVMRSLDTFLDQFIHLYKNKKLIDISFFPDYKDSKCKFIYLSEIAEKTNTDRQYACRKINCLCTLNLLEKVDTSKLNSVTVTNTIKLAKSKGMEPPNYFFIPKYNKELFLEAENHILFKINSHNYIDKINNDDFRNWFIDNYTKTFKLINIDSLFINPQLRTQKMLEEYKNSSTQGASVVRRNLEIDSFYQIKIFVPTISEQEKIGSFFQRLDNTIVLQHQKLAKCQSVKKSLLQQMFI